MKHLKTINLIIFMAMLLTTLNIEAQTQVKSNTKSKVVQNNSVQKKYKLKGFKQSCCTGIVAYSLSKVEGYLKSEADVKNQELRVWYDTSICTEKKIKEAINKTPYKIIE